MGGSSAFPRPYATSSKCARIPIPSWGSKKINGVIKNFLLKNFFPKNKEKNFITPARGSERVFKNID